MWANDDQKRRIMANNILSCLLKLCGVKCAQSLPKTLDGAQSHGSGLESGSQAAKGNEDDGLSGSAGLPTNPLQPHSLVVRVVRLQGAEPSETQVAPPNEQLIAREVVSIVELHFVGSMAG